VLGEAGFFFKTGTNGDVSDLRDKMQYLLDNPALVAQTGDQAQARINELYTWDRITERYEELFVRLASRK
jgi:glycosyltransferase involved in cell wall biosynthesis